MKRLYYLTDTIESVDSISNDLHTAGVTDWNFHVMSKDESGLYKHHIHGANLLHRLDIIHAGEQGALLGVVLGLGIGTTLMLAKPLDLEVDWLGIAAIVVFMTLLCTWLGGFFGITQENYKIKRFHDDLNAGKYLIMVDFKKGMEAKIRSLMQTRHSEARYASSDSTWMNPFKIA